MDLFCRRCLHWEERAGVPRRGEPCPVCGAVLSLRRRPSPSPSTHLRALIASLRTTQGVLFLVLYALTLGVTSAIGRPYLAALLLYAGAVRLAWRAMNLRGNEIEFPQLGADDLLNSEVLRGVGVFSVVFVAVPVALLQVSTDGRLLSMPVAAVIAGALFLYAPMALLLYLRSSTAAGMLHLPAAIGLVTTDPRGYAFLSALVLPALGLRFALHAATGALGVGGALALGFVLAPVEAVLVLIAFGLCGLFVRSKARLLRVACDDDDWEPGATVEDYATPQAPPRPLPPSQPVALPPIVTAAGQVLLADDIPAVTGQLVGSPAASGLAQPVPRRAPASPATAHPATAAPTPGALDWPWDGPAASAPIVVGQVVPGPAATAIAASQPPPNPAHTRSAGTQIMGSVKVVQPRPTGAAAPAPVSGLQAVVPVRAVAPVAPPATGAGRPPHPPEVGEPVTPAPPTPVRRR